MDSNYVKNLISKANEATASISYGSANEKYSVVSTANDINYFISNTIKDGASFYPSICIDDLPDYVLSKLIEKNDKYLKKQKEDKLEKSKALNKRLRNMIRDVIFNDPWTIVKWNDGTVTRCKVQSDTGDTFSKESGLSICIAKKFYAENENIYHEMVRKWC